MPTASKGKLRIVGGTGQPREISREAVEQCEGLNVRDALEQLLRNEVRDPELLGMLGSSDLALELAGRSPDGDSREAFLSPRDQWDRVTRELDFADCELGMARSHQGGRRP